MTPERSGLTVGRPDDGAALTPARKRRASARAGPLYVKRDAGAIPGLFLCSRLIANPGAK
jgi:hypothetical protein